MPNRYSPASLRLAAVGVTHERLARRCGVSRAAITHQLTGVNAPQPYLFKAIRTVAGTDVASDVAEILGVDLEAVSS